MNTSVETSFVAKESYAELLKKLNESEREKAKLARLLRASENRNAIFKLNAVTQTNLNKTITDEKKRQELYVRLLLESCPNIIFVIDENMKFLLGTNSITDIINIDDVSLLHGRTLESIVDRYHPVAFTEEMVASVREITENENMLEKKLEITSAMNKYAVNILSFNKNDGKFAGVLVIMHDITELVEAREIAEQASHAKGDFLSRMSHEMRTPMNAIIGMTNIAKGSRDQEKKEYCLDKIESASKHLLGVINDILDMSKIEANKFELSLDEFDFEKMLMNVTNVINFRIEEKKQNFIVNVSKGLPFLVIGDELRLTQVLTNLLTNAVKFTPEGGTINLNIKILSNSDEKVALQIEVSDNGIGISAEQQNRLFHSFEQADGGIARKYGGTGLGLVISKRIVELMGGQIEIQSELGNGSKFIFTIEVEKGKQKPQIKLALNKNDIRILAVDDSLDIRNYFNHVMAALDLSCDVAEDAYEALKMVAQNKDKPYNIFFVDWQMPGMNGIELTKEIKESTKNNAVIIMISVAEWSDIEVEAVAAGVNRFVSKPLFPSVLINNINECLDISYHTKTENVILQSVRSYKNHTILIAEDMAVNREIMSAILESTEIVIDFAENGLEAVKQFEEHPDKYNLILMDIHMPEMDGFEATRKIRNLDFPQARTIPILAMTANVFREDIENCLKAGMNDHIGKPVDNADLLKKLDRYLPIKLIEDERNIIMSENAMPNKNESPKTELNYEDLLPIIDVQDGLNRMMKNKKLYLSLLKKFSGREMADEVIRGIRENDFSKTRQAAHTLKGVSANMGFPQLTRVSADIEAQAKQDLPSESLIGSLEETVEATARLIEMLLEHGMD